MSVHSFNYDSEYEPPAPVAEVTVYKAGQSVSRVVLSALIDSGADATMLPIAILQTVGARHVETRRMRGVTGVAQMVDLYAVTIELGNQIVPAIWAIATLDNKMILGRDVLNQLVITLNGPAEVTEVS